MPTSIDWSNIIAVALGLYGTVLSTILAVREWRKDRRSLKVWSELTNVGGYIGEGSSPGLAIRAVNNGHRPITIQSVGVVTSSGIHVDVRYGRLGLPKELTDGKKAEMYITFSGVKQQFKELGIHENQRLDRVFVRDVEGHQYFAPSPIQFTNESP